MLGRTEHAARHLPDGNKLLQVAASLEAEEKEWFEWLKKGTKERTKVSSGDADLTDVSARPAEGTDSLVSTSWTSWSSHVLILCRCSTMLVFQNELA